MRRSLAATLLVVGLTGCTGTPPLPPAPELPLRVRYSPATDSPAGDAFAVTVEVWAVQAPVDGPAVDLAAVVLPAGAGAPFRGAAGLPPGTRWLSGADAHFARDNLAECDAAEARQVDMLDAEVGPGLATRVFVGDLLQIDLGTRGSTVTVRLDAANTNGGGVPIDAWQAPGVLFVPSPGTAIAGHVVVLHEPRDVFSGDHAERVAALRAITAAAAGEPAAWRVARQALGADNLRQALLALAIPLDARPTIELLLVADERTLRSIADALPPHPPGPSSPTMAWPLQRAAWQALLPAVERDALPAALFAVCIEHLGALADDGPTLRHVLGGAADEASFRQRLRDENHIALTDREAARRVRAHDWLVARGLAVTGFDPLAPLDARRQALRGRDANSSAGGGR